MRQPQARLPRALHPRLRRAIDWLIRLRGSPEAIARGVAIGMIVSFTPTIGVQTLIALTLATLLGANRPVSIAPTWITNPVTLVPIYGFTFWIGSRIWPGPAPGSVSGALLTAERELANLGFLALRDQFAVFLNLGFDVFVPLWIGGLIVGGFAAAVSYPATLYFVVWIRDRETDIHRGSDS